jgi:transglutaminase-like putative cysteine protease
MSTLTNAFPFSAQPGPDRSAAAGANETTIRCDLEYDIWSPSHFIFHIKAAHSPDQHILTEQLLTSPLLRIRDSHDGDCGNRVFRFDADPGRISLRYDARVKLLRPPATGLEQEQDITTLPDEALPFLLPSRFCPSDVLSRDAQYLFGHLPKGYGRVEAVCEWIRRNIDYRIGSSGPTTTALDVYNQRAGVCRDFAHLAITFCRGLNIPARLVVGYCHFEQPPQDFHALFEVWLGGRWVMFDPTALAEVKNIVRIGTGHDAKNTAFSTVYGAMQMTYMQIQVNHKGAAPSDDPDPVEATVRRIASMH